MKIDMSKWLPWVIAASILGGSVYSYARGTTVRDEQIKNHTEKIQRCEFKQDAILKDVQAIKEDVRVILTILRKEL